MAPLKAPLRMRLGCRCRTRRMAAVCRPDGPRAGGDQGPSKPQAGHLVGYAQLPRLVVPDYGRAAAVGADELDAALQGGQRPVGHGVARRRGPVQLGASDGHATPRQAPLLNFICPGHRRRGLRPHPGRLSANSLRRLRARRMGPSRCSPQHSATTPQPTRRSPQGP